MPLADTLFSVDILCTLMERYSSSLSLLLNSFVPPMDKKNKGERKPSEVIVERVNSQGRKVKYRVIDNATRLHPKVRGCVMYGALFSAIVALHFIFLEGENAVNCRCRCY